MTATQPDSPRLTRRGLMRTTAVGLGAAAGVGALGSTAQPAEAIDWGDVGKFAATTVVGGPVALGFALRSTEPFQSDAPPEGLTADALKQQVYQTARTRKSTNASTIVDNRNILDGVENNAYADAKIAAIEELNAGSSESDVLDAATGAIDAYETTVRSNFLKSWNEGANEAESLYQTVNSHGDISDPLGTIAYYSPNTSSEYFEFQANTITHELPDGSEIDVTELERPDSSSSVNSPINPGSANDTTIRVRYDGETVDYLGNNDWADIWSEMDTTFQNVRDGISTWVTSVYGDVQSGEIDISELITPRERAEMLSDDESEAQAVADLAALNIPIDPEREATITIAETGATLSGTIGLTDESDGPIESGATYVPDELSGDVYFTTDVSQLSGTWDAYATGVDGGTITFEAEPYESTIYDVTTTAGETVSIPASDWTDEGDGRWTFDASDDLETTITEVDDVEYRASSDETQFETLQLDQEFTVDELTNTETGEQAASAEFEKSEPQNDENYISQEEWEELENQNEELIQKYEESQAGGGGGGGYFPEGSPDVGLIAAALGSLGVLYALFGQEGGS